MDVVGRLPGWLWEVPYAADRHPGASPAGGDVRLGANCQVWAYALLAGFGFVVPPLRSDELFYDTDATATVATAEPARAFDLLLFNPTAQPYGAHVAVWIGRASDDDRIAHLCAEVGRPAVWSLADFFARTRYRVLVGIKRPVSDKR